MSLRNDGGSLGDQARSRSSRRNARAGEPIPDLAPLTTGQGEDCRSTERIVSTARMIRTYWVMNYRRLDTLRRNSCSRYGEGTIPRWDGGLRNGRRHEPIWPRIAAYCLEEGLDPLALIRGFFSTQQCLD